MNTDSVSPALRSVFEAIVNHPWRVLLVATFGVVLSGAGLGSLIKDTSVKAFIPADHESLKTDQLTDEIFGLSDSIAVAIVRVDGSSIFDPASLTAIAELTDVVRNVDNIRYDKVTSLALESSVSGDGDSIFIEPYLDYGPVDETIADSARARWSRMYPHMSTLVSDAEDAAVIIAEVESTELAEETYLAILEATRSFDSAQFEIHVAGPAAISGYLSRYIDQDARKLQPLVFVVVLGFIVLAFRRVSSLTGPLGVVAASVLCTLGWMGWLGVPYFAITNALPVIVVAISVADSIHVLSTYFRFVEQAPTAPRKDLVVAAMCRMARPITLTTITTIAGFVGIAAVSVMPPVTWFAIFAATGVALAWLFSLTLLPALLVIRDPGRSPAFSSWTHNHSDAVSRSLSRLTAGSRRRSVLALVLFAALTAIAMQGASLLRIDRSQVENFAHDEPIRIADETINAHFAGSAFLDVFVEASAPEGLLEPSAMQKIQDLQRYFEQLEHVGKTVSIADYVSLLHGAIEGHPVGSDSDAPLPDSRELLSETLFLYELNGKAEDLDEEIDRSYQFALVRGVLDAHRFSETRQVVEALQRYIDDSFNDEEVSARLTGDVAITYHWMSSLEASHFKGVGLSLVLVFLAATLVFRSLSCGALAVLPVLFTVLTLYACMGYLGIYLEPATSMFAAIALGVGVDFAIHLIDQIKATLKARDGDLAYAFRVELPTVARACFFNSAALGVGFAVLLASDLPTLMRFGGLIAVAALASYVTALLLIPAAFTLRSSWFSRLPGSQLARAGCLFAAVAIGLLVSVQPAVAADDSAVEVAAQLANRAESPASLRTIDMTLSDSKGRVSRREARLLKRSIDARQQTRITFVEPRRYRDMSFLSDEDSVNGIDLRWTYLPAAGRSRSIPAARRGASFFGTEFSIADMQSELKFELDEWEFSDGGRFQEQDQVLIRLNGKAISKSVARELGYGSFIAVIDAESLIPVRIDFEDAAGKLLKTIEVGAMERHGEFWTATDVLVTHHRSGRSTRLVIDDVEHRQELPDQLFLPAQLGSNLEIAHGQ